MGADMSQEIILSVKDVSKRFGGVQALSNVSFELKQGEILGIIGPNGSGKTTLVNTITGFVPVDQGKVVFKGKDITNMKPHKIADAGLTRTFQVMRPYYSLAAYKNLIVPLFSPRSRRTGGWRGGGKLGDRNTVAVDILEEIGFERDSYVPYKTASSLPTGYLKTFGTGPLPGAPAGNNFLRRGVLRALHERDGLHDALDRASANGRHHLDHGGAPFARTVPPGQAGHLSQLRQQGHRGHARRSHGPRGSQGGLFRVRGLGGGDQLCLRPRDSWSFTRICWR
jgi:ABC-type sugar transport system ATPase subunit